MSSRAWCTARRFVASLEAFRDTGIYEILGRGLILFVAFIPFFAFWELGSLTGETKLFDYFFKKGDGRKIG